MLYEVITFVVSKGNYTADGISGTGVFFVDLYAGDTPIELIANTSTEIPNVRNNFV